MTTTLLFPEIHYWHSAKHRYRSEIKNDEQTRGSWRLERKRRLSKLSEIHSLCTYFHGIYFFYVSKSLWHRSKLRFLSMQHVKDPSLKSTFNRKWTIDLTYKKSEPMNLWTDDRKRNDWWEPAYLFTPRRSMNFPSGKKKRKKRKRVLPKLLTRPDGSQGTSGCRTFARPELSRAISGGSSINAFESRFFFHWAARDQKPRSIACE